MIDMHSHLLFGVDDGCQTLEESLMMLRKAVEVGVTDLILTPHYAPMRGYVASHDTIENNFRALSEKASELGLPIRLYLGREIDEVAEIETLLKQGVTETMNHTNYVLVDFGMNKADIDEYCYELIINGYKPIIAHPERYNYIDDYNDYHRWRKTGALIQINATSLFHPKNKQTKKNVQYLLKHQLIDLIGSDSHRNPENYVSFRKAMDLIQKKYKGIRLVTQVLLEGEGMQS